MNKLLTLAHLQHAKKKYLDKQVKFDFEVLVCGGAGCVSSGCKALQKSLVKALDFYGLTEKVHVITTGCMGACSMGPELLVNPGGYFYIDMDAEKVEKIVAHHLKGGRIVEEMTYLDPISGKHIHKMKDIPFFQEQVKIVLRNCGVMEISSLEAYIAREGYFALYKALYNMSRQEVVNEVKKSGLRGRGGAGFPTGVKWQAGYNAREGRKYIICNADEGDPGAFMDRSVLEGDPHSIIEAMLIGGYTIGAKQGYVYVRAEYPLALERLTQAIKQAEEAGLLGNNILGSEFCFEIEIRIGAGAFVCGEETALIASIEGERGEPQQRPPFPFEEGLWGYPTIIDNVETLANIPAILQKGADWYASYGTEKSCGTKAFTLAGDINNTGIIEIPMGMPLRRVIYEIGGGIPDGKEFKAVQSGGPSGGCLVQNHLSVSVDYESLPALGAIMGSGGMIVMNEETCMVDTARYFLDFTQDESCGKCIPCRLGTKRMLELLEKITGGEGNMQDLKTLEELAYTVRETAMCGLGQTAPNPLLTTLRYFRQEYQDHIRNKTCAAKQCKALITYAIDPNLCRGCTLCKKQCPKEAIKGELRKPHAIDPIACVKCGSCMKECRFNAIQVH